MVAERNDRALWRWWHLPPKPTHRVVLAAIVAVIAITATFSAALVNHWGGTFGPSSAQPVEPISVQALATNGTTATPLAGSVVTVSSLLPVFGSSGTPSSAGVAASEVLLWQGTTGADGIARGDLDPSFGSIARNWTLAAPPMTAPVSSASSIQTPVDTRGMVISAEVFGLTGTFSYPVNNGQGSYGISASGCGYSWSISSEVTGGVGYMWYSGPTAAQIPYESSCHSGSFSSTYWYFEDNHGFKVSDTSPHAVWEVYGSYPTQTSTVSVSVTWDYTAT